MRLYLVTTRATAQALQEKRPLNYADSLILDDITDGVLRVPHVYFYNFSWIGEFIEAGDWQDWKHIEEVVIDFPDEVVDRYELPCPEGGNSKWRLPLSIVTQYILKHPPRPAQ
jgi:hypothetical protein